MTDVEYSRASDASELCLACGLCCTGHLFSWVRLKATELAPLAKLGLNVIRDDPRQRGFTQPCPMWNGKCAIYNSHSYPRGCDSYKCKLLRELLDERISLSEALPIVQKTKTMIRKVDAQLPESFHSSFRERFIAQVEAMKGPASQGHNVRFMRQAEALLNLFENSFGMRDFFDPPETL